jgi:hypothetical protein
VLAKKMKKEVINSPDYREKSEENQEFIQNVRRLTNWHKFNIKKANSFNSLLYCYEENNIPYDHLGVNAEVRQ